MILTAAPHVLLVPMTPHDVTKEYIDGLNDPEVNRFLECRHTVQTRATVHAYILDNMKDPHARLWGIHKGGDLHGTVRLHNLDRDIADIGICLFDKRVWRNGLGHSAIRRVIEWAADHADAIGLQAGIMPENIASVRVFTKAGFRRTYSTPEYDFYGLELG